MNILGYFHGVDPAAALIANGELRAYVEEERLIRFKHADGIFPIRSLDTCLRRSGLDLRDVDYIAYGWDAPRYSNGDMERFYATLNARYAPDLQTVGWQRRNLQWFSEDSLRRRLAAAVVAHFGARPEDAPPLVFYPHHAAHAAAAFYLSPFAEALVLTVDGSGDRECTVLWHGKGTELIPLERIEIPHSLGWFYAAMTEYLGFSAYDGEYKLMGLAAYGRANVAFRDKLAQVLRPGSRGFDYVLEPRYVHHGPHTYSGRFTDHLVELLELPPRCGPLSIGPAHEDLAFETQRALEECVLRLLRHFRDRTGLENLCIGGGVGLNVKMNSRIQRQGLFREVFAFPVPNDSGLAIGAPIGFWVQRTNRRPEPLRHLFLGPAYADEEIEALITSCGMAYRRCEDIAEATAELLAEGKVVGWFQGALEAGPRALGGRSILADPRTAGSRDRVNAAIKFREYWRPFCPSLTEDAAPRFMKNGTSAPYMIFAFEASEEAKARVPAVVHVDDTMRVQTVDHKTNPMYYRLLKAFEARTGVPVLLNTSFNVKGEAMVCSPRDAFRTFWSTGLDALAIGPFLVQKCRPPVAMAPEDVSR